MSSHSFLWKIISMATSLMLMQKPKTEIFTHEITGNKQNEG